MTEVINADMMIAIYGEEDYYRTSSEILHMGNAAYKMMGIDNILHIYIHTYKTFMAVANDDISDEDFAKMMKTNHEQYELSTARKTGLGGVSRFVLVFGDDLINRAKSAYYMNRHLQNNFIIASNEKELLNAETENTLKIFDLLNYAITNNKIDVFYQGIHSNTLGKINKYEALMRVYDQNDNIVPPGVFLEISKKLKLYLTLSKTVVNKALTDFADKDCELTLNLSLFDIQSDEFRLWFYERLKQHPDTSKIIVEVVETENYNNNDAITEFLAEIRKIGCKLAVDDFGSGFATYASIISVKPDIIKVDGEIIKNLTNSNESNVILDSICYMAKLIGSDIVAEFVENEEIQSIISEKGIEFSQGYLFAKPTHFDNLTIN